MTEETVGATPPKKGGMLPFLIDFGPLLIFFAVFKLTQEGDGAFAATAAAIRGTLAFMLAITVALIVSKWKLGRVSPMLWMSAILVIGFGALTIYFHDEKFIQLKPTIIYAGFAAILLGGWWRGRPMLRYLLEAAYDGLDEAGWMKLSRNWGIFFASLALANEVMRATMDFDLWLTVKVWGITAVTFIFALTQIPLMMRHGLALGEEAEKA
ncbi:MAG: septation protein IspZ [Sphingopyxis sp.]|nr:septation protein IspZ [Sphingopyxis sp.]